MCSRKKEVAKIERGKIHMLKEQSLHELNLIHKDLQHPLSIRAYVLDLRSLVSIKDVQKKVIHFFVYNDIYQDYQIPYIINNRYHDNKLTAKLSTEADNSSYDFYKIVGKHIYPFGRLGALYLMDILQSIAYRQQAKMNLQKLPKGSKQKSISREITTHSTNDKPTKTVTSILKRVKIFFKDFFYDVN